MSLEIHPEGYSQWHSTKETVIDFFKGKLTELDWGESNRNQIIMDVGCGHGGTTKSYILPFFSKVEKLIAFDLMPGMINIARIKNAHPLIEYVVADITDWSTIEQWEGKISKVISIYCFHWIKNQKQGFENIHRLLVSGGEAAFFFLLDGSFFDAVENLQNSSKWFQYLKDRDSRIPDSRHYKYDASYYKNLVEEIGFDVLHCRNEEKIQVYSNDENIKNVMSSVCVWLPYIPQELKEDFKEDFFLEMVERNGLRTETNLPFHRGQTLEMVVKKK